WPLLEPTRAAVDTAPSIRFWAIHAVPNSATPNASKASSGTTSASSIITAPRSRARRPAEQPTVVTSRHRKRIGFDHVHTALRDRERGPHHPGQIPVLRLEVHAHVVRVVAGELAAGRDADLP